MPKGVEKIPVVPGMPKFGNRTRITIELESDNEITTDEIVCVIPLLTEAVKNVAIPETKRKATAKAFASVKEKLLKELLK